jgi:hypothetical protein
VGSIVVTIGGTNRTAVLDADSFMVQERSGVAVAEMRLDDRNRNITIADRAEVIATEAGVRIFAGLVAEVRPLARGRTKFQHIVVQDYNALLDEDVIPVPAYRSAMESDRSRVMWLFTTHGTKGITANTFVQTVIAQMPVGEDGIPEQDFGGKTFREALDYIARLAGAAYHVDFNKELHWYPVTGEGLAAPWHLSATPNNTTTFMAMDLETPRNVADFRNAVFVRGATNDIAGWVPDPPPAVGARRAGVLRDEGITSVSQRNAAGQAYLAARAISDDAVVSTLKAGLRTGMTVQITSPLHGITAKPFTVREITTTLINKTTPVFNLVLGSTPPTLGGMIGGVSDAAQRAADAVARIGAITAGEPVADLSVGGGNLVSNSSFENALTAGWTVGAQWAFGSTIADAYHHDKVARISVSSATVGNLDTPLIRVVRLDDYWLSAWVWLRTRSAGTAIAEVIEYASNGTTVLATHTLRSTTAVDSGWTRLALRLGPNDAYTRTAFNATTVFVRMRFRASGTSTMLYDVDAVQIERGKMLTAYAPSPYELLDLSVTGNKIADGAVVAAKIADANLTTAKFAAGIRPVEIVGSLPGTFTNYPQGAVVFLTTDNKLYRSTGSAWTKVVDAGDIAANSITAGQIAAGAISTTELAAKAITVEKLAIGTTSDNLVLNGGAESGDTQGWATLEGTPNLTSSTAVTPSAGTRSFAMTGVGVAGTRAIEVTPGQQLVVRLAYRGSGTGTGLTVRINHRGTAYPTGDFVTTALRAGTTVLQSGISLTTSWQYAMWVYTVPAAMYWISLGVERTGTPTTVYFDDAEVRIQQQSAHIADGAITANKVVAGAIEADKIASNAVTADKVAANAIVSGKIAANTISAVELQANAIAANHIQAGAAPSGDGNLLKNPSFELTTITGYTTDATLLGGWFVINAAEANMSASATAKTGSQIGIIRSITGGTAHPGLAQEVPVIGGHRYRLSGWIRKAVTGGQAVQLIAHTRKNGVFVNFNVIATATTTSGTFQQVGGEYTVPSDGSVDSLRIECRISGLTPTSELGVFEDIRLDSATLVTGSGNVRLDADGITITNGMITVNNPGGTVIIDGSSNMHKIIASGTLTVGSFTGPGSNSASVLINTGLTYRPSHIGWQAAANPGSLPTGTYAVALPAFTLSSPGAGGAMNVLARLQLLTSVESTSQTRVTLLNDDARTGTRAAIAARYAVYKEEAI